MAHDYETSKKTALRIITILGIVTVAEVCFALAGKGHIVEGWHFPTILMGGVMILMSAFKAYLIIYEFMHMKYEVPGLVRSVLLPTFLLVWGIIAFLYEGNDWGNRRELIDNKNKEERFKNPAETGLIYELEITDFR